MHCTIFVAINFLLCTFCEDIWEHFASSSLVLGWLRHFVLHLRLELSWGKGAHYMTGLFPQSDRRNVCVCVEQSSADQSTVYKNGFGVSFGRTSDPATPCRSIPCREPWICNVRRRLHWLTVTFERCTRVKCVRASSSDQSDTKNVNKTPGFILSLTLTAADI